MYDSPISLQDLCLDVICDNLDEVFEQYTQNNLNINDEFDFHFANDYLKQKNELGTLQIEYKYRFKERDQFLFEQLSQALFDRLISKGLLNDETITLFSPGNTRLANVKIKNAFKLTRKGLSQIIYHDINSLECINSRIPVIDIIRCLSNSSVNNLKYLNISRCTFDSYKKRHSSVDKETIKSVWEYGFNYNDDNYERMIRESFFSILQIITSSLEDVIKVQALFLICYSLFSSVISIAKLKNLRKLNVSDTEFNTHALDVICEDLKYLQSLNISNTRVGDISPLVKLKDKLTCLSMFNLTGSYDANMIPVILKLVNLTYLDISCERPDMSPFEIITRGYELDNLLKNVTALPHLIYLDMSGKQDVEMNYLREFVLNHHHLRFLGLMFNECCQDDMFVNPNHIYYRKQLTIAGMANEQQIVTSLKMYTDRANYIQKSLYYLFRLSPSLNEPRPDIINLVLPGMANHPNQFGVQMAATACLYNLTKGELAAKIHPNLLKNVVNLSIDAMQNYPSQIQIQKNVLLTLCSDRILQDVNFEKFRCAKLVIMALCSTDDASMNRMAVAIISILAAKITTEETSIIGSVPAYMKKLLSMIKERVNETICDITLKFTLSALWNLTDESAITCTVFLQEGGITLFLEVLNTFAGESSIETKVLGLINNIAEVSELRSQLMIPDLITKLQSLLQSEHIDVSYFAAGIVAHLASDGEVHWTINEISRAYMLQCLSEVVSNWKTPDVEMVAYRTFRPFFPLLKSYDYQIQLWAVWAVHHVCTKNPKRYCQMLLEEGGNILLETVLESRETNILIRQLAATILETVQSEKINL